MKGLDRRQAVAKVCKEHGVSPSNPPKLIKRVANNQGLPPRQGHGAFHEKRINEEDEELIKEVLQAHAYDLTFRQLEELIGITTKNARPYVCTVCTYSGGLVH